MKKLLKKEFTLALHPTTWLFVLLASMLLIPNYLYFVVFFYSCLGTFFITLAGRENNDITFSLLLPVEKRSIVKARILMISILELSQIGLAVPFVLLNQRLYAEGNLAGLDANIALLGLGLVFFGIFNYVFFTSHYRDVRKVGKPFLYGCLAITVFMLAVEASVHAAPFVRDRIDSRDPQHMALKLAIVAAGLVIFLLLTLLSYRRSARAFEIQDL